MSAPLALHPDRLFPADPATRALARRLHASVRELPIVSPHGHCDAGWFARDAAFENPLALLVTPDHYLLSLLNAHGVQPGALGVPDREGRIAEPDPRAGWRTFARHYHVFRGTPSRLWFDWVLAAVFGIEERLDAASADACYARIEAALKTPAFRPRALFERFGIEVLATTESPLDTLAPHRALRDAGWNGRVIPSFRPDPVLDPEYPGFRANLEALGELTGEDAFDYAGYLRALRQRRADFIALGATASDHGHPSAATAELGARAAATLFRRVSSGKPTPTEAERFRAHMLTVMAGMSVDDGLVMQLHAGALRDHDRALAARYGRDRGGDVPVRAEFVRNLKPLLDRYGAEPRLTLVLFTLDESTWARELAPLCGHYPCLRLGAAWWFHDSPDGMRRLRRQTLESCGFGKGAGFADDTRAFCSIPARHDLARRIDCGCLAELVIEHQLEEDEAMEIAGDLAVGLARKTYRL